MGCSYAISWKDASGARESGALRLGELALNLEGTESREIPYEQVLSVTLGRGTGDRLQGRMTLILELSGGSRLLIAPVTERAALLELVEQLSALTAVERT